MNTTRIHGVMGAGMNIIGGAGEAKENKEPMHSLPKRSSCKKL